MSENWCIIPARGGSKAIPKKNIVLLNGKPLIAYMIRAACKAFGIDRVIVSTDDEEIAATSIKWGAEVPFLRPVELASDSSPTLPTIIYTVNKLEQESRKIPGYITLLQATSPFTRPEQIDESLSLLKKHSGSDSVTTVLEVDHVNHPFNIRHIDSSGYLDFYMPAEHYKYPTRQSKPEFLCFGNLYVMTRDTLIKKESLFGDKCLPLKVDRLSSYDINDMDDLKMAESMINAGIVNPSVWMS